MSILPFIRTTRARFTCDGELLRAVYWSELSRIAGETELWELVADKAPLFYREVPKLVDTLKDGFFVSPFKETLNRLPTSKSFQESHLGEIAAAIFAQEVLGLRMIYSKLSMLTAENANAYKMDLVLYDPASDPLTFIFGEVKSSPKSEADGLPPGHDKTCYASIFDSLREYETKDREFDLVAARDRVTALPPIEQERVRSALLPYATRRVRYAGFAVIDNSTRDPKEMKLLATRRSGKEFDVDVIGIEGFPLVAQHAWEYLDHLRTAARHRPGGADV